MPEGEDGQDYYLPDDLTDKAVGWLHAVRAQDPGKPWFLYYSTGCSHAPHQVQAEWSDKYRGRFDDGWDAYREQTFARQKQLGVIPDDAELSPRPDALPAWDSLSAEEKKLYARQMEVYAGYQENADWNVGRMLDAIEEMGELDDTLVIYIWGDNGASMEGTVTGTFNELTMQNGIPLSSEQQLALIGQYGGLDAWGSDSTAPHYAAAWAWASNCPFPWGKQVASHLGGTRNGMVLAWPRRIEDRGGKRSQFTHCIDIGPTIWKRPGFRRPGSSTASSRSRWKAAASSTPSTTKPQRNGTPSSTSRSTATGPCTRTAGGPAPCSTASPGTSRRRASPGSGPASTTRTTTSGSCTTCPTISHRPATSPPSTRRSRRLQELFWREADRYQVLPLLAGLSVFFGILPPMPTITKQTFYGDVQNVLSGMIPRVYGHSYAITADLQIQTVGAEGVIVANADRDGAASPCSSRTASSGTPTA